MTDALMRRALYAALLTPPQRRQQLFSLLPKGTFKGDFVYFSLAKFFAHDTRTEDWREITKATNLDPVPVADLIAESNEIAPLLAEHLVRLLAKRQEEALNAHQNVLPWASAIVRIKEEPQEPEQKQFQSWPPVIDLLKLSSVDPSPPKFIMKDWLPCGYATLFAGHGGIGKSGLALVLAVCLAMGIPFFGLQVERRRVMYLSCEDRENVLHWRLARICDYFGITIRDLVGHLDAFDLVGHNVILYQPGRFGSSPLTSAYHELATLIKTHDTEVLFVDGISDTYDGNENARAEVKAYVNAILALIPADRGAAVLVGHVAKPTANGKGSEYSGTTGWHNSVRARWYLYPDEKSRGDEEIECIGDLLMELRKSNLGPNEGCLRFSWDKDAGMFTGAIEQVKSHERDIQDGVEQAEILAVLRASTGPVPAAATGPRTAYHVLSVQDHFPKSLRAGNAGKKRFWRHIERLRALGEIREEIITRTDRHKVRVLVAKT